ncbi:hypothetical protein DL93DRAFT_2081942 [Clavulina sp. PMI_390]|nr:hypothetical protein DL93DRAFT_2081942 [Clavulina sp. PMI_390]
MLAQTFLHESSSAVEKLKKDGIAMSSEIKRMMQYFGEAAAEQAPSSPEGTKPEDFFALMVTFSCDLQASTYMF